MSLIHIVDKQTDTILDDITEKDILSNEHYRSLKDTVETFEFVTFADKRFSPYLEKRNRIIIPDEDRGFSEFIITNSIKIHEQDNLVETEVYADASYLELKKSKVIEPQTLNQYTVSMHAGFALNGTAWQVGFVEKSNYRTIVIERHTNPYDYLRRIAKEFDLELNFRIEIEGNRILGRYVDLVERIGTWRGVEVEFGKNLDGIRRNEKTNDIVTALIGLGPEPEEDEEGNVPPRLEVYVEDNEALERWGFKDRDGNLRHLIDYYEVDSNDPNMTLDELLEYTRRELEKRIKEIVEYEANIHDLEHVPGLENYKLRFGDTIRIKDTKFNPPLYMEARIHTQKRNIKDKKHKQVTLGDYEEFTEEEVTAIWQQLQQEIRRKVDLYQMLEYTYDKETIDWKDQIVLGDGQEYSRNVSREAEENAKEYADDVSSEAERLAKEYADRQIVEMETSILEQTVAQAIFDTTIDEIMSDLVGKADNSVVEDLRDLVAEKADFEWVEGQLVDKVNVGDVYLIEDIDNMFDNVVSVTRYETDMKGIVTDLESHETRITQTEVAIETKVERTEFEQLEGDVGNLGTRIDNAFTAIEQNADEIALRATKESVDTLAGEVEEIEAELVIHADLIASKVEQDTFDSVTNTLGNDISRVEQTAQGISQEVGSIRADLDGLEIGGRNLLEGTTNHPSNFNFSGYNGTGFRVAQNKLEELLQGGSYTVSGYFEEVSVTAGTVTLMLSFRNSSGGAVRQLTPDTSNRLGDGESGRIIYTFDVPNLTSSNVAYAEVHLRNTSPSSSSSGIFKEVQLEKGNKATDWYPAPEDTDNRFGDIEGTLSSHNTRISQNATDIALRATKSEVDTLADRVTNAETAIQANAEQIELRATKTSVDALAGRVSTAESTITQHADAIEARVEKDGVIAAINLSSESATINASKINLVGAVTVLSDITGDLGSITAGTIRGVNIIGAEIVQDGADGSIVLDNDGFHKYDSQGRKRISISNEEWEFQGFSPATIVLNEDMYPFMIGEGTHGLGDAFIGYPEVIGAEFNIANPGGTLALSANELWAQNQLTITEGGINGGLGLLNNSSGIGASDFKHVIAGHTTNDYLVVYPQRWAGQDTFRIRSHNGKSDYVNEMRITQYGDLLSRSFVKAQGFVVTNNAPVEGETNDRYQFQYNPSNGNLDLISKSSSGTWYYRVQLLGRGQGSGIQLWDVIESEGTRLNTGSSSTNLRIGPNNGRFYRITSTRKNKIAIEPIKDDPYKILNLVPKTWYDKHNTEEYADLLSKQVNGKKVDFSRIEDIKRIPGLIAEDVEEAGLDLFVDYDEDNQAVGLQYDRLWTLLIPITKDHQEMLIKHDEDIDELKKDVEWLRTENELLKQRVSLLEKKGA